MRALLRGLGAAVGLSFRADRRRAVPFVILFVIRPLALIAGAYVLKLLVDAAARGDARSVVLAATGIALVNAAGFLAGFQGVRLAVPLIEAASHEFERELMSLTSRIPWIDQYENAEYADRIELLRAERLALAEGADLMALQLGVVLRALVTAVLLAMVSPYLLILPLLAVPVMLAGAGAERRRQSGLEATASDVRRARHLFELATAEPAGKELRLFGLRGELLARHDTALREVDQMADRAARAGLIGVCAGWALFAAGHAGALMIVTYGAIEGTISLGDVVLTLTLIASITLQMGQTVRFTTAVIRSAEAGKRLLRLRSQAAEQIAPGVLAAPQSLIGGIELRDVSFAYRGSDKLVLDGVSVTLPPGSVVGVVGENGAGKSTLVKLLARLYEPSSGAILIDGVVLSEIEIEQWRERISAGFQDFARLEFQLRETVGVGYLPDLDDKDAIHRALERGAAERVPEDLPGGIAAPLGASLPNGTGLSGGQWQKLALARAMMRPTPLLLLLDEPTSAVDALTEDELLERYADAARHAAQARGGITIIVSHRFASLRAVDTILVLAEGRLIEHGSHDELLAADGLYAELYTVQAKTYR